jgi:GNAT superfamily N-acetyltransferase
LLAWDKIRGSSATLGRTGQEGFQQSHPLLAVVNSESQIRFATPDDVEVISWHRARMFQDMGQLPDHLFESFRARSREYLCAMFASGEYIGWLTFQTDRPKKIVAGAGVLLRQVPPFPVSRENGETAITDGRQALIVNVFTEPEWRRRGLARQLMEHILAWSREQGIESIMLHASDDGRALYEQLGFIATSEMRFSG